MVSWQNEIIKTKWLRSWRGAETRRRILQQLFNFRQAGIIARDAHYTMIPSPVQSILTSILLSYNRSKLLSFCVTTQISSCKPYQLAVVRDTDTDTHTDTHRHTYGHSQAHIGTLTQTHIRTHICTSFSMVFSVFKNISIKENQHFQQRKWTTRKHINESFL